MTENKLLNIVTEFRAGIVGSHSPRSWCFMVSWPLQAYLKTCGYETVLVEGYFDGLPHDWLALPDGKIIDATASQFPKRKMPKVYIGTKPEWYRDKKMTRVTGL